MKRILLNVKYICKLSLKLTSVIFAILGFVGIFAPLDSLFSNNWNFAIKISLSCIILFFIWIMTFLISCLHVILKNKYKVLELGNGHCVFVQYGNVFSSSILTGKEKRRNIAIPVNRCFDTIVDDDLISTQTLHGISMKELYNNHLFTQTKLNLEIQRKLSAQGIPFEELEKSEKPKGNRKRYEAGAVVEIPAYDEITYFFLGYTAFDKNLHANTSEKDYVLALMNLLIQNNLHSQGYPLVIPLIGAGAADFRKEPRDILEYIVKLIKLNRSLVNSDIYIVIRDDVKNCLAITNL